MVSINFFCVWKIQKKSRCWACGSLSVILWGKRKNRQRFRCKNCDIFFTRKSPEQKLKNRFVWFKKWVIERQTYKIISRDSGLSKDTLQRIFYKYLSSSPGIKIRKRTKINLRIDGTYFKQFCLLCYQDNADGYIQLIRFSDGERYEEIKEDLSGFKVGIKFIIGGWTMVSAVVVGVIINHFSK